VGKWTLGNVAVWQPLTARANGGTIVVFQAHATAGPAAQMTRLNGSGQVSAVSEKLAQPLRVLVADSFNNPVADVTVTFTVTSGEGRIEGGTAVTNVLGSAESGTWTLGSLPGVQQVRAQAVGTEVVFSAFAWDGSFTFLFVRDPYIYKATGIGQETRLTEGWQPAWSPDGRRIAFTRYLGDRGDIYLMDADGSNVSRRTYSGSYFLFDWGFHSPAWSPDGRSLAVATLGWYDGYIYTLSVADDGNEPVPIKRPATAPAWSPDGSKIAFVRVTVDNCCQALDVINPDGSGAREVASAAVIYHPAWSPDGRRIAFSKCTNLSCDVYTVSADGSDLRQLTNGKNTSDAAWSPDGALIIFTLWTGDPTDLEPSIALVSAETSGNRS
jgi:Tol biopolymer transport system component